MPRKNSEYQGPPPVSFEDPLLRALGVLTEHVAGVTVPIAATYNPTLRLMGVDPKNPPWDLKGTKINIRGKKVYKPGALHRLRRAMDTLEIRGLGFRALNAQGKTDRFWGLTDEGVRFLVGEPENLEQYCAGLLHALGEKTAYSPKGKTPRGSLDTILALKSVPVDPVLSLLQQKGFTKQEKDHLTLTQAGIQAAIEVRKDHAQQNLTTFWLGTVMAECLPAMEKHLSIRYPRSQAFNEIMDIAQGYLVNLMERDGLYKRLRDGQQPTISQLCFWADRHACSRFRNEGRDAHTRAFKGAMTDRDRRLLREMEEGGSPDLLTDTMVVTNIAPIYLQADEDGKEAGVMTATSINAPLLDIWGGDLEEEVIRKLDRKRGLQRMENVMRRRKEGAQDRYVRLTWAIIDGNDVNDIAASEQVSRNRAASLLATVRRTLIDAQRDGDMDEVEELMRTDFDR